MPIKIINVVGARPNFMRIASLVAEMKRHPEIEQTLVHTDQHYDARDKGDGRGFLIRVYLVDANNANELIPSWIPQGLLIAGAFLNSRSLLA